MKKIQAFLILGSVVSLILAIGFSLQKQQEIDKRIALEKNINTIIEAKKNLEIELNKRIESALSRVKEKENMINYLLSRLHKEKTIRTKLAENLGRTNTRLALRASHKKAIELEKIIVTSLVEAEGKVLAVDRENDLVVVNLGAINNVKTGDRFSIYRGGDFIAKAELVKVKNEVSAAMVLSDGKKDIDVKVNDTLKSL